MSEQPPTGLTDVQLATLGAQVRPPWSGRAIASFIATLAMLGGGFAAPVALILGVRALSDIRRTGKRGRGLAIFAVVVGAPVTLLLVLLMVRSVIVA